MTRTLRSVAAAFRDVHHRTAFLPLSTYAGDSNHIQDGRFPPWFRIARGGLDETALHSAGAVGGLFCRTRGLNFVFDRGSPHPRRCAAQLPFYVLRVDLDSRRVRIPAQALGG